MLSRQTLYLVDDMITSFHVMTFGVFVLEHTCTYTSSITYPCTCTHMLQDGDVESYELWCTLLLLSSLVALWFFHESAVIHTYVILHICAYVYGLL